ncbi:lipopolysaccharide biosynthesis protein [Streptomyces beijiangensis]|uniref:Lipopolysaccharide biosynthesis protein n=1 Tax=Streptomyces beijiangensis TaxID=163361 RepID=A0A939F9A2_9ACTN|nr:lipopolysaccharide biosynthesis protein [Streptomyces beijiangensis]
MVPGAVALGALSGLMYGVVKAPQYAATSYVIIVPADRTDPGTALGYAQAYGRVAIDVAVRADAAKDAGVAPDLLRSNVQAATSPDAPMISLTAQAASPESATAMADSVAQALVRTSTDTQAKTGVKVLSFSSATEPSAPSSPSAGVAALVGGCAGGLLGGLTLLVRPRRTEEDGYAAVPAPASASATAPQKEPV